VHCFKKNAAVRRAFYAFAAAWMSSKPFAIATSTKVMTIIRKTSDNSKNLLLSKTYNYAQIINNLFPTGWSFEFQTDLNRIEQR
jgi:hypothetical protein